MDQLNDEKTVKKKIIFRWVKLILLIYGIVGIALYYLQDRILLHPEKISREAKYDFIDSSAREINIPFDAQTSINIIQFRQHHDSIARGVVLYFHGNRKNVSWYLRFVADFTKNGYDVWMMDYPGFGKSTGLFTDEKLYAYALQVYKLARTSHQPAQIVIYGKSFGTGIAAQLASLRDCKLLVLETPYYSLTSLVSHYLPVYPINRLLHHHLPTNTFLPQVTAPIIIFHGTEDGLIPYSNAEKLRPLLKPQDEFITIAGGSHNDLSQFPLFHQSLDSALLHK